MRRVKDLTLEEIIPGLRLHSLVNHEDLGTVVRIDVHDDHYAWIKWDHKPEPTSGFYWTDCDCFVKE